MCLTACVGSDRVGANIIIYFYVFNLTMRGLETVCSRDCVADHVSAYRPVVFIALLTNKMA